MRLTLEHRFDFRTRRSLVGDAAGWDELRAGDGPFGVAATRTDWEALAGSRPELRDRARAILGVLEHAGARSVCSYGAGGATLELHLARLAPGLALTCTDFAPRTVERVAGLFPEATVVVHDLRADPPLAADLHLFHRVDTELSDEDWAAVFGRFRVPVLVAASELLSLRGVARELATRLRHPGATRAGWLRTEDALRALWRESHTDERVALADLPGYLLTPR